MKSSAGKRVLMLLENNAYPQDGRVRREATTLIAAGYQVSVISPKDIQIEQPWREIVDEVRVYRYPMPPAANGFLGYIWEYSYSMVAMFILSWLVSYREGFDIIHAHNPPDTLVLIAAFYKLMGKRFVFDHHDLGPELYYYGRFGGNSNRFVYRVLIWFEQLSCQLADRVIATNESYKAIEMERGKVQENQITIVRNGPDLDRLRLMAPDPVLRRKADIIIGYVGELSFQDGLDYLLRALHHLIYDIGRLDFYCAIIGDGDALDSLKQMAVELNIDEYIWFTGWLSGSELVRCLSTIDVGVSPDPSNPYNDRCTMIKISEYMALGKPIVVFDLPEHRVTAQAAAVYARPNDELDFARQIILLMDDQERRQKMGQLGRERIETKLAWSYQEKHLLEAYEVLDLPREKSLSVHNNF
ncbi:MAG: glycosyltransferase family 4 protein [Anaerolineae bacterium]|nr:glycosyltransferase family 4 protein [Anaerolineae bacterium]